MKDLEARIIEYLLTVTEITSITTDISLEKLPITVVDKKITIKVDPEITQEAMPAETATVIAKVWVNSRSPLMSEPVKGLKDLAGALITALNKMGSLLTKQTGGYDIKIYGIRKLGRTDDLNSDEKLWSSIITFECVKSESEPT